MIEAIDFGLDSFFGQGAGDFGISLVIYTLFIKLLIFPSYEKQLRSSANMQRAQPKLVEIRRRWGSNPEKMNAETARLYVEEGINPFAGFVPALI